MRRRLSLTAALVLLLSLLCACAAQHAQEMDENGYELYFLSDPNSAGGGDAIRTQEKRLTLDGAMETEAAAECERCEHHGGRARAAVPRDASAALGGYAAFLA